MQRTACGGRKFPPHRFFGDRTSHGPTHQTPRINLDRRRYGPAQGGCRPYEQDRISAETGKQDDHVALRAMLQAKSRRPALCEVSDRRVGHPHQQFWCGVALARIDQTSKPGRRYGTPLCGTRRSELIASSPRAESCPLSSHSEMFLRHTGKWDLPRRRCHSCEQLLIPGMPVSTRLR